MSQGRPDLTVVLPVLNERDVLPELYGRLQATLDGMALDWELLFVDDGSSDGTVEGLAELRARDPRVTAIALSRNFGHHAALTAGIDHARGASVVMMDADLQDQPEEIPKLWARHREGFDVVFAELDVRREGILKRLLGRGFWWTFGAFTGIKLRNPGVFRVVGRPVILALRRFPERSRFLAGIFHWVGFRQSSVLVARAPRTLGRTKYNLGRMIALSIHAITSFSRAPLRLAACLSALFGAGSLAMAAWVVFKKLVWGTSVTGWASLMVLVALGFAGVFFMLGVIGEYVANILNETQGRPLYLVREELGVAADVEGSTAPETSRPEAHERMRA
jgi:glycosyltransferase involved in cell wall biosynthesis